MVWSQMAGVTQRRGRPIRPPKDDGRLATADKFTSNCFEPNRRWNFNDASLYVRPLLPHNIWPLQKKQHIALFKLLSNEATLTRPVRTQSKKKTALGS